MKRSQLSTEHLTLNDILKRGTFFTKSDVKRYLKPVLAIEYPYGNTSRMMDVYNIRDVEREEKWFLRQYGITDHPTLTKGEI